MAKREQANWNLILVGLWNEQTSMKISSEGTS